MTAQTVVTIKGKSLAKWPAVCSALAGVFSSPLGDTARKACQEIRSGDVISDKWGDDFPVVVKVYNTNEQGERYQTHGYTANLGSLRALMSASEGITVQMKPKRGRRAAAPAAAFNSDDLGIG